MYLGIIALIQTLIFQRNEFFKKNNKIIMVVSFLIVVMFSYLQYSGVTAPFIGGKAIIVENINNMFISVLILLLPYFAIASFIYLVLKTLPERSTLFFKSKVYMLCVGMIVMLFGYTVYTLAFSASVSLTGVLIVFMGDLLIMSSILMPGVRKLLLLKIVPNGKNILEGVVSKQEA